MLNLFPKTILKIIFVLKTYHVSMINATMFIYRFINVFIVIIYILYDLTFID